MFAIKEQISYIFVWSGMLTSMANYIFSKLSYYCSYVTKLRSFSFKLKKNNNVFILKQLPLFKT